MKFFDMPTKGDPSDITQRFLGMDLNILCCRYWWLKHWESNKMGFPYWRLYWNPIKGAIIHFNNTEYRLDNNKIYLIPPNTYFTSKLSGQDISTSHVLIEGGRIRNQEMDTSLNTQFIIKHFFIHFTLGLPYDLIAPQIIELPTNADILDKINKIKSYTFLNIDRFDFYSSMLLYSIISEVLSLLPESCLDENTRNTRILEVLNYIENHISEDLSNTKLAEVALMSTNAFCRLFSEEIKTSPQKYVKEQRINKACMLLQYTENSIDSIAESLGFAERFHFSKAFKSITGQSPAKYKKRYNF